MGGELGNGAIKSRSKARQAASSEKGARQEIPPWAAGLRPPLSDGVQLHPASMGTKPTTGPTSLWGQESPSQRWSRLSPVYFQHEIENSVQGRGPGTSLRSLLKGLGCGAAAATKVIDRSTQKGTDHSQDTTR